MAAYIALYDAANTPTLDRQIIVALTIKANATAKAPSPTAAQRTFAIAALENPTSYVTLVRNYIFAEYNMQTISVITNATDAQVQSAVNAAVDTLLGV